MSSAWYKHISRQFHDNQKLFDSAHTEPGNSAGGREYESKFFMPHSHLSKNMVNCTLCKAMKIVEKAEEPAPLQGHHQQIGDFLSIWLPCARQQMQKKCNFTAIFYRIPRLTTAKIINQMSKAILWRYCTAFGFGQLLLHPRSYSNILRNLVILNSKMRCLNVNDGCVVSYSLHRVFTKPNKTQLRHSTR